MASPQRENGFTAIANEILENMWKAKLNGTQRNIIDVVWRYTYGFKRNSHSISENFIANLICTNVRQVKREVKKLIDAKILLIESEATNNIPRIIKFNKNYDLWCLISHPKKESGGVGLVTSGGVGLVTSKKNTKKSTKSIDNNKVEVDQCEKAGGVGLDTQERNLTLNLIKHKNFTSAMSKAIKKAMKENKYTLDDCKLLLTRHEKVVEITKSNQYKVTKRGLDVFFGQKVSGATHLICSEYEDGGMKYERYLANEPEALRSGSWNFK